MQQDVKITVRSVTGAAESDLEALAKKLDKVKSHTSKYSQKNSALNTNVRNLALSASVLQGQLGGVSGRLSAVSMMMDHGAMKANIMLISLASLTAFFVKGASEAIHYEKTMRVLGFATDDAGIAFKFASDMADKYGVSLKASVGEYAKFAAATKGTVMEGKATADLFEAMTIASSALGMSADETAGSFKAFTQMVSKGNVQAEELRGQLGERLVGAFGMAAKSMGVTTAQLNKMLELGQVAAEDLLPAMAVEIKNTFEDTADAASGSFQGSLNRMGNSWYKLGQALSDAQFLDALAVAIGGAGSAVEYFAEAVDKLNGIDRRSSFQKSLDEANNKLVELKNNLLSTTKSSVTNGFNETSSVLRGLSLEANNSADMIKMLSSSMGEASSLDIVNVKSLDDASNAASKAYKQLVKIKKLGAEGYYNDAIAAGADKAHARVIALGQAQADEAEKEYERSKRDYTDVKLQKRLKKIVNFYKESEKVASKYGKSAIEKENAIYAIKQDEAKKAGQQLLNEMADLETQKAALIKSGKNQYAVEAVEKSIAQVKDLMAIGYNVEQEQKKAHEEKLAKIEKMSAKKRLTALRDIQRQIVSLDKGTTSEKIDNLLALNDYELQILDDKKQKLVDNGMSELEAQAAIDELKIAKAQETADAISKVDEDARLKRLKDMADWGTVANDLQAQIAAGFGTTQLVNLDAMAANAEKFAKSTIKLDEMTGKEKLKIASGVLGMLSGLMQGASKRQFEIGKKAARAENAISTYLSATKAYESMSKFGPWAAAAAAAVAVAAGMANDKKISSTTYGGGVTAPTSPSTPSVSGVDTYGTNATQSQQTIGGALDINMNLSVTGDSGTQMSEGDMARLGEQLAPYITDAVGRGMGATPTI